MEQPALQVDNLPLLNSKKEQKEGRRKETHQEFLQKENSVFLRDYFKTLFGSYKSVTYYLFL